MSRLTGDRFPAPNARSSGLRRSDAAELSALVDDIAERSSSSQASLGAVYDLTADDLQAIVSRWATDPDQGSAEDIVVAAYAQLWRRAAKRPAGLPVRNWLTSLALAQILSLRRAAAG